MEAISHPWSSPHSISGKSKKLFKQSRKLGKSGISGKHVTSRLEYPECPENLDYLENLSEPVRKIWIIQIPENLSEFLFSRYSG